MDSDLRVVPYRKPLSLVREGLPKEQVSARESHLTDLPGAPLKLAKLVILDRLPEGPAGFTHVELSEALPAMFKEMSYLRDFDRPLQHLATIVQQTGGALRLTYSSARDILPLIPGLLAHSAPAEPWEPSLGVTPADSASGSGGPAARLTPVPALDAIDLGHAVMLFSTDGVVRTLGGLGPDVWRAALQGLTPEEAFASLVEQYGVPEGLDPQHQFDLVIQELTRAGILSSSSPTPS